MDCSGTCAPPEKYFTRCPHFTGVECISATLAALAQYALRALGRLAKFTTLPNVPMGSYRHDQHLIYRETPTTRPNDTHTHLQPPHTKPSAVDTARRHLAKFDGDVPSRKHLRHVFGAFSLRDTSNNTNLLLLPIGSFSLRDIEQHQLYCSSYTSPSRYQNMESLDFYT